MNVQVEARVAAFHRSSDLNSEAVVLADNAESPNWHVEFQRALEPDEQDRALGMDSYCVVFPDGATAYGCLEAVRLTRDALLLRFNSSAMEELNLYDRHMEILLDLSASQREDLAVGLQSVLLQGRDPPNTEGIPDRRS